VFHWGVQRVKYTCPLIWVNMGLNGLINLTTPTSLY